YPVRLRGGRLDLRLRPGVSQTEAVAFNQRAALRDGAVVEGGRVRFGPAVQAELRPLAPDLVGGFQVAAAAAAAAALHRLRDRLRTQPTS
ncbi:MAG TPA: potassium transporter TrkA, partial [Actinomycetes bacterium]|nr:potassium transporter TrkA [Actinomycetes bacterium]